MQNITNAAESKTNSPQALTSLRDLPPPALTQAEFAKALAHLIALKRTIAFSPEQITVWYQALSMFPAWIINRAVISLAATRQAFPDFADVRDLCKAEALKNGLMKQPAYTAHGTGEGPAVSADEITQIGQALGLKVKP